MDDNPFAEIEYYAHVFGYDKFRDLPDDFKAYIKFFENGKDIVLTQRDNQKYITFHSDVESKDFRRGDIMCAALEEIEIMVKT